MRQLFRCSCVAMRSLTGARLKATGQCKHTGRTRTSTLRNLELDALRTKKVRNTGTQGHRSTGTLIPSASLPSTRCVYIQLCQPVHLFSGKVWLRPLPGPCSNFREGRWSLLLPELCTSCALMLLGSLCSCVPVSPILPTMPHCAPTSYMHNGLLQLSCGLCEGWLSTLHLGSRNIILELSVWHRKDIPWPTCLHTQI